MASTMLPTLLSQIDISASRILQSSRPSSSFSTTSNITNPQSAKPYILQSPGPSSSFFSTTSNITNPQSANSCILSSDIVDSVRTLRYYSWRCNELLKYEAENPMERDHLKQWFITAENVSFEVRDVLDELEYELMCYKGANRDAQGVGQKRKFKELEVSSSFNTRMEETACKFHNLLTDHINSFRFLRKKDGTFQNKMIPTVSFTDKSAIVGLETDREKLVQLLLLDDYSSDMPVLPIDGMAGIGKTTLSWLLFNDTRVREHFSLKVWINVSHDFDVVRVTREVIESIQGCTCSITELSGLQYLLRRLLEFQTLLLVLDDVWNEESYKIVQTLPPHKVGFLSEEESWDLFVREFYNVNIDIELVHIAKNLIRKCEGLPIAIKDVTVLLSRKIGKEFWTIILETDFFQLELASAFRSLKLSYDLMPNHLKPCVAYSSFFPVGHVHNKDHLIRLWIAHGFVQPESGMTLMNIGLNYFHELVGRSFFQQVGSTNKSMDTYKMHGLIHGICRSLICRENGEENLNVLSGQHFDLFATINSRFEAHRNIFPRMYLYSHSMKCDLSDIHEFRFVRALELNCYLIEELPDSFGNLRHLRYLLLRCKLKVLPESTCNLYHLQMLDLCGCSNLISLPKAMGNLQNLWFLGLPLVGKEDQLISDMMIPKCSLPESVRELTNLQTFGGVFIGRDLESIKDLSSLVNIRGSFCISGLENVTSANDAKYAGFEAMKFLTKLCMQWRDPRIISKSDLLSLDEDVLENLKPSASVEELVIIGFSGSCFPNWLSDASFSKLTRMKLVGCRQNWCESLPSLGELPSLKYLFIGWMHGVKTIGREFCFSSLDPVSERFGFPSLEEVVFENMGSWLAWSDVLNQDFPLLRRVSIKYCCQLVMLPMFKALKELCLTNCSMLKVFPFSPNLKSLSIIECGNLYFLEFEKNLRSLENLKITFCVELKSITGLNHLASLRSLRINSCYKLQLHLDEGIPSMLEDVGISDCPALVEWCQRNQFPYKHIMQADGVVEARQLSSIGHNSSSSLIYGRDDEMKRIIDLFLSDYNGADNVGFIVIAGPEGIGKTRIARHVYNDAEISEAFETRIWVNMHEKIDEKVLMKDLIESLTQLSCDMIEPPLLQKILQEELTGKKFLLVLDGIEVENKIFWSNVEILLNVGAKGSFVIVTSRSELVGSLIEATHTYYLDQLPEEHCWSIFQQVFEGSGVNISPNLIEKGKKLVIKCNGNPMYVKVLIGFIQPAVNEEWWGSILESDVWEMDEHERYISSVLRLSYYLLPLSLKKCFGYCSLFPKNYIFSRQYIIHQWLSQGLVEPTVEKSVQDSGIQYFNNLFSRSFFEYSPFHDAQENKYVMPPVIHDLALYFSRNQCFTCEESHKRIPENARHLALVPSQLKNVIRLGSATKVAQNLYSLVHLKQCFLQKDSAPSHFANFTYLTNLFPEFRSLRTLDLSYTDIEEIPSSIRYLDNMVYLGLNRTNIERLPDEICTLANLQFLEARDCCNLVELPENMKQLTRLEHLDVRKEFGFVGMPLGIGQLTNLRSLTTFNLGDDPLHCSIGELKNLVFLRGHLQIARLENIRINDAREASLCSIDLEYLTLEWCGDRGYYGGDEIITTAEQSLGILKPVNSLKQLIIRNYMGTIFPAWLGDPSFSMLASITLDCFCNCVKLPALSHLPSLRHLSVRKVYGLRKLSDFVCSSGSESTCKFPSLELLNLWEMYELEELFEIDGQDFPRLHTLSISMCPELKFLPCFSSLMELSLHCCDKLINIPALPSLQTLKVQELENVKFLYLSSELSILRKLEINHCNELLSLEGLSQLTVDTLKVVRCPKFHPTLNSTQALLTRRRIFRMFL